jgi:hypothetical protein
MLSRHRPILDAVLWEATMTDMRIAGVQQTAAILVCTA